MNGILLVNKPKGITSHDVVAKVRKVLKMKAVGHAGTLDPMAEGLLIIMLGEATKFSSYIMGQDKHYVADVQLGLQTDSWDAEGEKVEPEAEVGSLINSSLNSSQNPTSNPIALKIDFTKQEILNAIQNLVGPLKLEVPIYSAVKIKGQKLYDYARKGQSVQTPIREMNFYSAELLDTNNEDYKFNNEIIKTLHLKVDLKCEKGSYIRSWVHQLGKNLGSGAIMSGLVRHQSGNYLLKDALDYSLLIEAHFQMNLELNNDKQKLNNTSVTSLEMNQKGSSAKSYSELLENITSYIKDIKDSISGPFYRVFDHEIRLLKNGQIPKDLNLRIRHLVKECQFKNESKLVRIFDSKLVQLIAVLEINPDTQPKILRAFNN